MESKDENETPETSATEKKSRGRPKGPPKPPKESSGKRRGRKPLGLPKPTHAPFATLVTSAISVLHEKKGVSKIAIVKHIMDSEPVRKGHTNRSMISCVQASGVIHRCFILAHIFHSESHLLSHDIIASPFPSLLPSLCRSNVLFETVYLAMLR